MHYSTGTTIMLLLLTILLGCGVLRYIVRDCRKREQSRYNPGVADLRREIKDLIRHIEDQHRTYSLSDPISHDKLYVSKSRSRFFDPILSPQRSSEIISISYLSGNGLGISAEVKAYRFPSGSIYVHVISIPWDDYGDGQVIKALWRQPQVATVEELTLLRQKMTSWLATPVA